MSEGQDPKTFQRWWHLKSMEIRTPFGEMKPFGDAPRGALVYLPEGRMFVQMANSERPKFPSETAYGWSDEEARQAFDSVSAYYGRYEVDWEKQEVRHFVEVASIPNWTGTTQVRAFTLRDGQLELSNPVPLPDGSQAKIVVVWTAEPAAKS